jgi:hypothetical protein
VSDGRGLFLEGKERVTAAVQAARSANVFVIFVVLDNPKSRVRDLSWFRWNPCYVSMSVDGNATSNVHDTFVNVNNQITTRYDIHIELFP